MKKCDFTLIIPSLDPDEKLTEAVKKAADAGIDDIILVDDGSSPECRLRFYELERLSGVTVLTHEVNRGKGEALKTAFSYFLENRPDRVGVVTADGDGQHAIDDIIACAEEMTNGENAIVLGCRDFSLPDVPKRSRFGNTLTSRVFRLLCGMRITDTQTGLRAIPKEYLPDVICAKGSRYEYETNMLLLMNMRRIPFREVTIKTVYIDDNSSSHFRPVRDSLRVYGIIFKFIGSSLMSSVVDITLFHILGMLLASFSAPLWGITFLQTALARVVSSAVNFSVNRYAVFGSTEDTKRTYARYAALAAAIMLLSWVSVSAVLSLFGLQGSPTAVRTFIKIPVDAALFLLSFRVQQKWVFAERNNKAG